MAATSCIALSAGPFSALLAAFPASAAMFSATSLLYAFFAAGKTTVYLPSQLSNFRLADMEDGFHIFHTASRIPRVPENF